MLLSGRCTNLTVCGHILNLFLCVFCRRGSQSDGLSSSAHLHITPIHSIQSNISINTTCPSDINSRHLLIWPLPCSYAQGNMWNDPLIYCGRETSQLCTVTLLTVLWGNRLCGLQDVFKWVHCVWVAVIVAKWLGSSTNPVSYSGS